MQKNITNFLHHAKLFDFSNQRTFWNAPSLNLATKIKLVAKNWTLTTNVFNNYESITIKQSQYWLPVVRDWSYLRKASFELPHDNHVFPIPVYNEKAVFVHSAYVLFQNRIRQIEFLVLTLCRWWQEVFGQVRQSLFWLLFSVWFSSTMPKDKCCVSLQSPRQFRRAYFLCKDCLLWQRCFFVFQHFRYYLGTNRPMSRCVPQF